MTEWLRQHLPKLVGKETGEVNYPDLGALQPVRRLLKETARALNEGSRTLQRANIPEVVGAAAGTGGGAALGAGMVAYGAGAGTSGAAALTSGLAFLGGLVGGGMAAGIAVVAAPPVILGVAGSIVVARLNRKRLAEQKSMLLQDALRKHDALIRALAEENKANRERVDYLQGLVASLKWAIDHLQEDVQFDRAVSGAHGQPV